MNEWVLLNLYLNIKCNFDQILDFPLRPPSKSIRASDGLKPSQSSAVSPS